jgi:Mannitol repressor
MVSRSATFEALNALAKEIPEDSKIRGLLRIIESRHLGSDYAIAIIGASLVERALEAAILARFVPLGDRDRNWMFSFQEKGPLADLGARSRFGLALGLYGEPTFKDLEKIRRVRNLFAHSPALRKFSEKPIARACAQFNVSDFVFRHEQGTEHQEPPPASYVTACLHIAGRLKGRLENASEENGSISFPMSDSLLP